MDARLRKSMPARVTAAGFVLVVIFGNLWLAQTVTGGHPGVWIGWGFSAGLTTAALGGLGLAVLAIQQALRGAPLEEAEPLDGGPPKGS